MPAASSYRLLLMNVLATSAFILFMHSCRSTIDTLENRESADSLSVYLERGICFGRCPVYNVSIYRSGYVIYHGKMNVERIGTFSSNISDEVLDSIFKMAEQTGYFALDHEYRNPHLTDFPTIRSSVNDGKRSNSVLRYTESPPADLIRLEDFIDTQIDQIDEWQKISSAENQD